MPCGGSGTQRVQAAAQDIRVPPNGLALKLPALTRQQQRVSMNVPRNSPRAQRPLLSERKGPASFKRRLGGSLCCADRESVKVVGETEKVVSLFED